MNNLIVSHSQPLTMSHYQIADVVGSRPDSVKRTMERLSDRGVIELTPVVGVNHLGQHVNEYHVDKRNSYIVVAQLSPEFTAELVDRWQELEGNLNNSWIAKLSPEAKIAIEDLSKQIEVKDTEIERLQGVCNTVTAQFAPGLTISTLCKSFNGVNIMQVNNTLIKMGMLNKTKHGYEPTSYARDNYFTVSYEAFEKPNGSEAQRSNVTLTLKGAKWLYKAYLSNKLPMKKSWDGSLVHVEFEVK